MDKIKGDIAQLAVHPQYRRMGVATEILLDLLKQKGFVELGGLLNRIIADRFYINKISSAKRANEADSRILLHINRICSDIEESVKVYFKFEYEKDGLMYYSYSYTVDGDANDEEIRLWLRGLTIRAPWKATGNARAIVL